MNTDDDDDADDDDDDDHDGIKCRLDAQLRRLESETERHFCLLVGKSIDTTICVCPGVASTLGIPTLSCRRILPSWRFDRNGQERIPFLSAMSLLQAKDGERASYPEIVDELSQHGANTKADSAELFRRMVFNILVSNVDDHLRNHGFFMGWQKWLGFVTSIRLKSYADGHQTANTQH